MVEHRRDHCNARGARRHSLRGIARVKPSYGYAWQVGGRGHLTKACQVTHERAIVAISDSSMIATVDEHSSKTARGRTVGAEGGALGLGRRREERADAEVVRALRLGRARLRHVARTDAQQTPLA
eukprot:scaffold1405_cov305-Prasinococcus_capsulatus_cf.AAC.6